MRRNIRLRAKCCRRQPAEREPRVREHIYAQSVPSHLWSITVCMQYRCVSSRAELGGRVCVVLARNMLAEEQNGADKTLSASSCQGQQLSPGAPLLAERRPLLGCHQTSK